MRIIEVEWRIVILLPRTHESVIVHIAITINSNNSLSPLMVTMTPFGYMAPRSKGMYIVQTYIEFLHSLSSAFPPTSTLYNIYIYRPETR